MKALVHRPDGNLPISADSREGVHLVVPPDFLSFFIASTSAAAALVGLLFVAVALAPEQNVTRRAPVERQAVAGSAFTALANAFLISLTGLIPRVNFGAFIVPISSISLVTSLIQAWALLRLHKGWLSTFRRASLVCLSLALYGTELWNGTGLLTRPTQIGFVYGMLFVLLAVIAFGLARAWELLGARRYSITGWLSPLQDVPENEPVHHAEVVDPAPRQSSIH